MIQVTFTLDDETVAYLGRTADRLGMPKSQVVREAIRDFGDRAERLSERERQRLLEAFDRLVPAIPSRAGNEVDRVLAALTGPRRSAPALRRAIEHGNRLLLPSLVLTSGCGDPA